jgi:hypothetical protein
MWLRPYPTARIKEQKIMTIRSGLVACGLSLAISIQFAAADTFTVTNTTDGGPGSLRKAITDANGQANIDANTPDIISFAIPGVGVQTITPSSPLPAITDPVVIDGYTQPGASANTLNVGDNAVLLIELNGANTTGTAIGLDLAGGKSTVRGLVINRFGTNPNAFFGSGGIRLGSDNNVVAGNFIGSNAAGSAGLANAVGVTIDAGANNLVGGTTPADRNIFAGNNTENSQGGGVGVQIRTNQPGTRVQGNYIGTNAAGNAPLGNGAGIYVVGLALSDITIGGLTSTPGTGAGNVISGNSSNGGINSDGIYIASRPGDLIIQGNIIGLDAAGTTTLANGVSGINLVTISSGAGALLIGGTATGARNVIYNNRITGIVSNAIGLTVQGNFIGTDITGTSKPTAAGDSRLRGGVGIDLGGSATIGGDSAAARNVISCDGTGLFIFGGSVTVQGNFIGTTVDGVTPLGNNGPAVRVENDAVVTIGGAMPGQGNVIANSLQVGVVVKDTARVTILGNSMFSNGRLGIDLNDDAVTPNDTGDADTGPNLLQNYPVLKSTTVNAGTVQITGSLNSTASTTFRLEFFGNDKIDPSGFGQGRYFLGFANATTDASGNAAFDLNVPVTSGAAHITATATDPSGNSSEFSAAIGQLLNISTRLRVETGDNVLIGGFIITGTDPKRVIVRGIGPSLAQFFPAFLADPTLDLYQGNTLLATNDDWKTRPDGSSQQAEIEATTIPPTNDLEAALVRTLPANNADYTAIVRGKNNTTGIGVVEGYDLDTTVNSKLANISTRGFVESGDNVLIGGFIAGNGLTKVIVRAIGPTLINIGVANPLQDPTLELHDGSGTTIRSNDNWKTREDGTSQQSEIEATTIPPANDFESALVQTLTPGNYTAIVRGKNNTTGIAVVEVYNIP